MSDTAQKTSAPLFPTGATYVDLSAETILKPGTKINNFYGRNMTQPYEVQRLSERACWVQPRGAPARL